MLASQLYFKPVSTSIIVKGLKIPCTKYLENVTNFSAICFASLWLNDMISVHLILEVPHLTKAEFEITVDPDKMALMAAKKNIFRTLYFLHFYWIILDL